jgi:hypothetical protein
MRVFLFFFFFLFEIMRLRYATELYILFTFLGDELESFFSPGKGVCLTV